MARFWRTQRVEHGSMTRQKSPVLCPHKGFRLGQNRGKSGVNSDNSDTLTRASLCAILALEPRKTEVYSVRVVFFRGML